MRFFIRQLVYVCVVIFSYSAHSGIFDIYISWSGYTSSNSAIYDAKRALKYAKKCTSTPLPHNYIPGTPTKKPIKSCVKYHKFKKNS